MRKLNSIHYGSKVITVGLIFLFLIPLTLFLVKQFLQNKILNYASYTSIFAGLTILLLFFFILIIELNQDKKIDRYFQMHKKVKINLTNGKYECGCCGNRNISESDTRCNVCGVEFQNLKLRTSEDILKL